MHKTQVYCDLKLDCTYLDDNQIQELIEQTVNDGFNVMAVCKNANFKQDIPNFIRHKAPANTLILNRINIQISNQQEIQKLKQYKQNNKLIDIVSIEFQCADLMENFLKQQIDFEDHLIYINLDNFQFTKNVFQQLKKKTYYLEVDYKSIIYGQNQKQSLINFFKVFDSLFQKIILSSNASRFIERRARWELDSMFQEFLKMSQSYYSKLFLQCTQQNPVQIVQLNKFKKEGGISFEQNQLKYLIAFLKLQQWIKKIKNNLKKKMNKTIQNKIMFNNQIQNSLCKCKWIWQKENIWQLKKHMKII